jgi:hypothetical protein
MIWMSYTEDKRFDWYRVFMLEENPNMGGISKLSFSDHNFEDNARDGHGNDWPIRYKRYFSLA